MFILERRSATTAEYVAFEGMLLAHVSTGAVNWVHVDHLGTPQMLTDDTGAVVWDASYRPFGEASVTGSVAFNLRFPGQYFDAETGLHYNYYRDYDAGLGRYVQSDPIGLRGGWNTYAYVGGNPVTRRDPDGLDKEVLVSELWERWEYYENSSQVGVIDAQPTDVKRRSQKIYGWVKDFCTYLRTEPIIEGWDIYNQDVLDADPPYRYNRRGERHIYGYHAPGEEINFKPDCIQGVQPQQDDRTYFTIICKPERLRVESDGWQ